MRPLPRCRRGRGRGQGPASRVRGAGQRPLAKRQAAASPGPCRPLRTRARAASRAKAWGQNVPDSQRQNLGWGQGSGSVGPWGSQGGRPAGLDGSHGAGPPGSGFGRPAWGLVYRANRKRPREQGRRSPGRRKAGGPSKGRTNNNSEKENNEKSRLLRGRKAGRCGRPGQGRRLQTSPEARAGPRSGDGVPCCRGHGAVAGCYDSPANISCHPRINRGHPDLRFSFCQAAPKKQQTTRRSPCKVT